MQEKISQLEKELIESNGRIASIENSVTPLFNKMDKLTEAMIKNTESHRQTAAMQERIIKRQDKLDLDLREIHDELSAARPAVNLMNGLSVKMTYFGFIMITISVTALIVIAKGGA